MARTKSVRKKKNQNFLVFSQLSLPVSCQGFVLSQRKTNLLTSRVVLEFSGLALILYILVPKHLISGMHKELKMSWIRNFIIRFVCLLLSLCDTTFKALKVPHVYLTVMD